MSPLSISLPAMVVACILTQLSPCNGYNPTDTQGTIEHIETEPVLLTLNLNYDTSCPGIPPSGNQTIDMVELPLESLIINVLEYASKAFGILLQQFELVYFNGMGYNVISINGLAFSSQCKWTMITDPPISELPLEISPSQSSKSINDVFVSNYGMILNLTFESRASSEDHVSINEWLRGKFGHRKPKVPPKSDGELTLVKNPTTVNYTVSFPYQSTCPKPAAILDYILVNITSGQTALNVIEKAADSELTLAFTVHNWFGLFYSIRGVNTAYTNSDCQWCVKFSPSDSSEGLVPPYLLSVAPNDFTIPVFGGTLILEYTGVGMCNFAQNNLNKGIITKQILQGSKLYQKDFRNNNVKYANTFQMLNNGVFYNPKPTDQPQEKPTAPTATPQQIAVVTQAGHSDHLSLFLFIVAVAVIASVGTTFLSIHIIKTERLKLQ